MWQLIVIIPPQLSSVKSLSVLILWVYYYVVILKNLIIFFTAKRIWEWFLQLSQNLTTVSLLIYVFFLQIMYTKIVFVLICRYTICTKHKSISMGRQILAKLNKCLGFFLALYNFFARKIKSKRITQEYLYSHCTLKVFFK